MGFVRTLRPGDTGIGFTLETLLGLKETNVRGRQDFTYKHNPVELKSQRRTTVAMMTLFTKEPHKPLLKDKGMIKNYGYTNARGRPALKVTITPRQFVPQGLKLETNGGEGRLTIIDREGSRPWYWTRNEIEPKIGRLVLVFADTIGKGSEEKFHYNEAYHLSGLDLECFFDLIDKGDVVVNLRMHLKPGDKVRNHGTAFRIRGLGKLLNCYSSRDRLL